MADRLEQLRNYVAVIDSGGVNAAAAALGIAKSAVSRRLGELEERLGATLVQRSTRSFEPTSVGRRYYEGARAVLAAVEALDAEVSPQAGGTAVPLMVVADPALRVAVSAALAALPQADVAIVEVVDASAGGEHAASAPLWIGTAPPDTGGHDRLAAGTLAMRTVGSPELLERVGRPANFADLRSLPGVATASRDDGGWRFGSEGAHGPRIVMTVPDDASAVAAACAGAGLARVASTVADGAIAAGMIEQVLAAREPAPTPIDLWVAKDAGTAVRGVADHLAAALAARA